MSTKHFEAQFSRGSVAPREDEGIAQVDEYRPWSGRFSRRGVRIESTYALGDDEKFYYNLGELSPVGTMVVWVRPIFPRPSTQLRPILTIGSGDHNTNGTISLYVDTDDALKLKVKDTDGNTNLVTLHTLVRESFAEKSYHAVGLNYDIEEQTASVYLNVSGTGLNETWTGDFTGFNSGEVWLGSNTGAVRSADADFQEFLYFRDRNLTVDEFRALYGLTRPYRQRHTQAATSRVEEIEDRVYYVPFEELVSQDFSLRGMDENLLIEREELGAFPVVSGHGVFGGTGKSLLISGSYLKMPITNRLNPNEGSILTWVNPYFDHDVPVYPSDHDSRLRDFSAKVLFDTTFVGHQLSRTDFTGTYATLEDGTGFVAPFGIRAVSTPGNNISLSSTVNLGTVDDEVGATTFVLVSGTGAVRLAIEDGTTNYVHTDGYRELPENEFHRFNAFAPVISGTSVTVHLDVRNDSAGDIQVHIDGLVDVQFNNPLKKRMMALYNPTTHRYEFHPDVYREPTISGHALSDVEFNDWKSFAVTWEATSSTLSAGLFYDNRMYAKRISYDVKPGAFPSDGYIYWGVSSYPADGDIASGFKDVMDTYTGPVVISGTETHNATTFELDELLMLAKPLSTRRLTELYYREREFYQPNVSGTGLLRV